MCVYCAVRTGSLTAVQVYHNDSSVYPVTFHGRNTVHTRISCNSALLPIYTAGRLFNRCTSLSVGFLDVIEILIGAHIEFT